MSATRGALLVATAALLWALIGLFAPPLLDEGMTAVGIGAWRAGVGGVLFAAVAVSRPRARRPRPVGRDLAVLLVFGAGGVGLFYAALPAAIETGGVSLAWVLLYTAPVWVALAAWPVLRERPTARIWGLVAVTAIGIVLVASGGGDGVRVTGPALAWGLTAGLAYATWYLVGRGLGVRLDAVTIAAWSLPVGALALAPFAGPLPATGRAWLLVLGLGVVSTFLPVLAYYTGVRHLPAARAAIIATVEPVAALAIGAAVFDERLTTVALAGSVLVLAAAVAAGLPTRRDREVVTSAARRR